MLQKIGRWASGRVQGSKGVKKYDTWMQKNPWAKTALGIGDLALAFYGPGMIGKGLQKVGGMGKLAGTGIGRAATSAGNFLAGTPATNEVWQSTGGGNYARTAGGPATKGIMQRTAQAGQRLGGTVMRGAQAAGRFAAANPQVTGAVLQAAPMLSQQSQQAAQQRQMNEMMMQQSQFGLEEAQRRAAQREQLMELLRPLFLQMQQGR